MKILAIDLGHSFGWCYKNDTDEESGHDKYTDLLDWGSKIKALVDKWKPEILVLSQTNNFGHWNASRAMLLQAGVAFYLAGRKGVASVEFNDSSARKEVFGKALKKIEVQKLFPDKQADELDAIVLARGWDLLNN